MSTLKGVLGHTPFPLGSRMLFLNFFGNNTFSNSPLPQRKQKVNYKQMEKGRNK